MFSYGATDVTRTHDLLITNQLLYQLSYSSIYEKAGSPLSVCERRFPGVADIQKDRIERSLCSQAGEQWLCSKAVNRPDRMREFGIPKERIYYSKPAFLSSRGWADFLKILLCMEIGDCEHLSHVEKMSKSGNEIFSCEWYTGFTSEGILCRRKKRNGPYLPIGCVY